MKETAMRFLPFAMLALCAAPAALAQIPSPSAAERQTILDRIRAAALSFADRLQDFTCTQLNVRTVDRAGTGKHYKPLDTQEIELTYAAHKEHYRVLQMNGKPVGAGRGVKPGYFTAGGEFGSSFRKIFDPKAKAQFDWDHETESGGRRTCVFRYRVPLETTTMVMHADLDDVPMAHHGLVEADCDSGDVTRIRIESEPASLRRNGRDVAVGATIDVRYGPVAIAGREFWLPREADETALFYTSVTRVQIGFQQYRKYDSSSTVVFGDPKE